MLREAMVTVWPNLSIERTLGNKNMRFRTFLVTGVEVLHLGGQHWESNSWPAEHWRQNKGRFRLFTEAIDEQISGLLQSRSYGGLVEGIVVALEVASFDQWPAMAFSKPEAPPSFKHKHRDLWCFAKLDWTRIQGLSLKLQFLAYVEAVLESLGRINMAERKPKGFDAERCALELRIALNSLRPSSLSRTGYAAVVA